jgi:uncharacterized protein
MNNKNKDLNVVVFLILVFILPLIGVLLIKNFSSFQDGIPGFTIYGFQASTPTIAALITVTVCSGRKGAGAFLKRCYFFNLNIKYIALALILPTMVLTITKLTALIFLDHTAFAGGISVKKLIIIMWALVAEELGWRGFLQEKLDKHCGHIVTPVIVGSIWALWHYHFFWLGSMSAPLILFFIGCICDSYGYYWVTKKSNGNVIPASMWHFMGNLFFNIYFISPEHNHGSFVPYLIFILYSALIAAGISTWGNISSKKGCTINL